VDVNATVLMQMARMVQQISQWHLRATQEQGQQSGVQKAYIKTVTVYSLAALMGWCGVTSENSVLPIRPFLLNSKDTDDHCLNIMKAMRKLLEEIHLEFDEGGFLKEKTIKALVEM